MTTHANMAVVFSTIFEGEHSRIQMTPEVYKEFCKLDQNIRDFIKATMEMYGKQRQPRPVIPEGRFNGDEGRHPVGHHLPPMQIGAFKHTKAGVRIYGSCFGFRGQTTFLCTEIDTNKRGRKANPAKLSSAATKLGNIIHEENRSNAAKQITNVPSPRNK